MTKSATYNNERSVARAAALEAARAALRLAAGGALESRSKTDSSPVTAADVEADRILKETLLGAFPEDGWLSEETADDSRRLERDRVWIVDPIDGTREFVEGVPEYAVSVALAEKGRVVVGTIVNPAREEVFEAARGHGAFLNGEPIRADHPLSGRPVVELSRSDIRKGLYDGANALFDIRPCGSIAYKLARLAAGLSDGVVSITPKNEWDVAAGVILVEEAGGKVGSIAGGTFSFNRRDPLLPDLVAGTAEAFDLLRSTAAELSSPSEAESRRRRNLGQQGCVVWLTGLSGSGKTTLARALESVLLREGHPAYVLDGDKIRQGLNRDLGFSPEDRDENIRRIGEVAALFADAGVIAITSFISPYREGRRRARRAAPEGRFLEVFLDVPLSVCEERDPKGLYKKARRGEIEQFTGVSAPYEKPLHPELVLHTDRLSISECVEKIRTLLSEAGYLGAPEKPGRGNKGL